MREDFFGRGLGGVFRGEGAGAEVEGEAFGVGGDGDAEGEDLSLVVAAEPVFWVGWEGREGGRR